MCPCAACGPAGKLSRRKALQTTLAAAAANAIGANADAFAAISSQDAPAASRPTTRPAVDIHAHYFPESYLNLFNEQGARLQAESRITPQGFYFKAPAPIHVPSVGSPTSPMPLKFIDLKQRIADMDQQGVAVQALSLTSPMVYWGDAALDHQLARAWNDAASAAHLVYPNRLVGLLTLPMLYPDRALDELNRAAKLPGLRGVYLGTNINSRDLDDPLFSSVWARIEQLDLPVFLHPLQTVGGDRLRPFFLENLLGNPFDTAIAASHLIFGSVLDRYPNLRVTLPHGGGVLPILIGRIDHGWQVRQETRHLPQAPSTYLHRFTYDTIVHSPHIMDFIIREVGADRVMIGSDYCFDMGYDRPIQFLDQLNLTGAQRTQILGATAATLLKL